MTWTHEARACGSFSRVGSGQSPNAFSSGSGGSWSDSGAEDSAAGSESNIEYAFGFASVATMLRTS